MPYDANGNYTLPTSYFVENGDNVLPIQHNPPFEDVAQALSSVILRSGAAPMGGALKMGNNKITGLAAGTLGTDAVAKSQLDLASIKYAVKGGNYTAVGSDNNTVIRFSAAATLALTAAATLGSAWSCRVMASGGDVTIDPDGTEQIDGAMTLLIPKGYKVTIYCDGTEFFSDLDIPDPYEFVPLGNFVFDVGITGFVPPPTNRRYRYIKLTSGLTGSGAYNEGCLTSEAVSGSSPLIVATSVISLAASPFVTRTIRLFNNERRFIRAGSPGNIQDDALQDMNGRFVGRTNGISGVFTDAGAENTFASGTGNFSFIDFRASNVARVANETRPRNIGADIYMRIL